MKNHFLLATLLGLMTPGPTAIAQNAYPDQPIRLVVPYPPGGGADTIARQIGAELGPSIGQSVIVMNKAGASGIIASDYVAKAPSDGYTLLLGGAVMAIASAFGKAADPTTRFSPISTLVTTQNLLAVRPSLPVNDLGELIAYAKANPGKLTYGSSGMGTPLMTFAYFEDMAGIDMLNVPYKGDSPAIADLLGGQIDMYATVVAALNDHVKSGRLRPIGVTGKRRSASFPDVPTIAEAGLQNYELTSWFGVLAPAGTPAYVIEKLNMAIVKVLMTPKLRQVIMAGGSEVKSSSPEEFAVLLKHDVEKYTRLVRELGLMAE